MEPVTSISPTVCVLLLVSGLGLLMASAAGGLFLNLVKNVYLTTLQNELVLRQLAEINPKEQGAGRRSFSRSLAKCPVPSASGPHPPTDDEAQPVRLWAGSVSSVAIDHRGYLRNACERSGSNSSIRRPGCVLIRLSTSVR